MRSTRPSLVPALGLVFSLAVGGCSADLREIVGPRIPIPNVAGRILRDDVPVQSFKVELRDPETNETRYDDRTDASGVFTLAGVGAGRWVLRADSQESSDWSRCVFEFDVMRPDTVLTLPDIDVSNRGLRIEEPEDGDKESVPSVFDPMEFGWRHEGLTGPVQVRLYEDSDGGRGVWFSNETTATVVRWNGLANQGSFAGRPVPPGAYRWRLRYTRGDVDFETAYYHVTVAN